MAACVAEIAERAKESRAEVEGAEAQQDHVSCCDKEHCGIELENSKPLGAFSALIRSVKAVTEEIFIKPIELSFTDSRVEFEVRELAGVVRWHIIIVLEDVTSIIFITIHFDLVVV